MIASHNFPDGLGVRNEQCAIAHRLLIGSLLSDYTSRIIVRHICFPLAVNLSGQFERRISTSHRKNQLRPHKSSGTKRTNMSNFVLGLLLENSTVRMGEI